MPSNKRKREARQLAEQNDIKYTTALRAAGHVPPSHHPLPQARFIGLRIKNCGGHRGAGNAETRKHELLLLPDGLPVHSEPGDPSGWAQGSGMVMTITPLRGDHRGEQLRVCWHCVDNSVPQGATARGRFHDVVLRAVVLSARWREEVIATEPAVLVIPSPEADALVDSILDQTAAPAPAKQALRAFFMELPEEDVMKLQTLMYVGRPGGGDSFGAMHRHLLGVTEDKNDAVRTMLGKTPLARYLTDGLAMALETGASLDTPCLDWDQHAVGAG